MIISHFTQYTGVCCIAKILDIVWCSDLTVRPRNWLRCAQKPYIPKISSFSCVFETFRYGYMHFTPKYMWLLLFWNSRHCVILGSDRATPQWTQMCPKNPIFPRLLHFRAFLSYLHVVISHFTQNRHVYCIVEILGIVWCSDLIVRPRNWLRCAQKTHIPKIFAFSCKFKVFRYGYTACYTKIQVFVAPVKF